VDIFYKNTLLQHILQINKYTPIDYVNLSFSDFDDVCLELKEDNQIYLAIFSENWVSCRNITIYKSEFEGNFNNE
jgi:hypothetical protein